MNINDLFDQASDHLQVISYQISSGELNLKEIKDRINRLDAINIDLVGLLPRAFKEIEIVRKDAKLAFITEYVVCEINNGATLSRDKAREGYSPSSKECKICNQCQQKEGEQ